MLNGRLPWQTAGGQLGAAICAADWKIASPLPVEITEIIGEMLTVAVEKRPTIAEISQNPVFAENARMPRARSAARQVYRPKFVTRRPIPILGRDVR
jgi:hypothetical protein